MKLYIWLQLKRVKLNIFFQSLGNATCNERDNPGADHNMISGRDHLISEGGEGKFSF